jgi:hypothetical protein
MEQVVRRFKLAAKVLLLGLALTMVPAVASGAPDSTAAKSQPIILAEADSILGRQHFAYASLGKRDPFASLLSGDFLDDGPDGIVDLDQVKLVGIMWGESDRFALVEDAAGYSYILREGDRVKYGAIMSLEDDRLIANITFFGMTRTVVKTIEKE